MGAILCFIVIGFLSVCMFAQIIELLSRKDDRDD